MMTVGHSNRPVEELVGMLKAHGVELLVDVRTVPRSRHNPQFNQDVLPADFGGIGDRIPASAGLGGLRRPRADSTNTGWRNPSFRGYADYMQTAPFEAALEELMRLDADPVNGDHVRRGHALALPPVPYRGCFAGARVAGSPRSERKQELPAPNDSVCASRGWQGGVPRSLLKLSSAEF